jgi:phosphatidylglycerophosphate synthase
MQETKSLLDEATLTETIVSQKEVFKDRKRTNFLRSAEQAALYFLVEKVPGFVTPNILTGIGFVGSCLVLLSFILSSYLNQYYLFIGIAGLLINWFGDSLDGRLAYYRKIPRKWYGFSLDIIMDWLSVVLMGLGFIIYAKETFDILAFSFVVLYGWAMIIAQLRYKITDKYTIDSGYIGPTELRVIISLILLIEILIPGSINYCVLLICSILLVINLMDTNKLLELGNVRDKIERAKKSIV